MSDSAPGELEVRGALLAAQLETAVDGILVVDPQGRILSRNRRFAEMWGIPADVLATGSDDDALRNVLSKLADPDSFLKRVRPLDEHPAERSFDELELRDGRVFERHSGPIFSESGAAYGRIWFFRDVSARVEAERRLARSNAELEMFAYAASHDLSVPLRRISALGKALRDGAAAKLDAAELEKLDLIGRSAEKAQKLVNDALALARVDQALLPPEEVDGSCALREVLEELASQISELGARVEAGPLPVLRVHAANLHSLLLNLVANALKFHRPDAPPRVRIEARSTEDGGCEIGVSDEGIGFEPEYAEKIFAPFLKLSGKYEGNGLGLALCRGIARRYGATLTARSSPGRGSTFTLRLPPAAVISRP